MAQIAFSSTYALVLETKPEKKQIEIERRQDELEIIGFNVVYTSININCL